MKTLFILFIVALSHLSEVKTIITGKVIKVSDGDTITILSSDNRQIKVRLSGIDCPESRQDFGTRAKQFTSDFCFSKTVNVEVVGQDKYNRNLGYVSLTSGKSLHKELLKAGLAWHYKYFDRSVELAQLEQTARNRRIGIWSMKDPVAPWDFRRNRTHR